MNKIKHIFEFLTHDDQWFWPFLKKRRTSLVLIFFLSMLTIFCASALMFTSGYLISRSARHPFNIFLVYMPVVLTRAFGIGRPVFKYLERLRSHDWILKTSSSLRRHLYDLLEQDGSFLKQHYQTGSLLSSLTDDLNHLENFYLRFIFPVVSAYLVFVILAIMTGALAWPWALGLILLLSLVLISLPIWSYTLISHNYRQQKKWTQQQYTTVTDSLLGLQDWQLAHRLDEFVPSSLPRRLALHQLKQHNQNHQNLTKLMVQLIYSVVLALLIVYGAKMMTVNTTLADYAASIVLSFFPLIDVFTPVVQAVGELPLYLQGLEQLNAFNSHTNQKDKQSELAMQATINKIEFINVSFRFAADQPWLLKNFNLVINAGEKIAILGPSGEGKTTLLQLLLGDLVPETGTIVINGIPVTALHNQRDQLISYLNQDPFIFNTTVGNNLRLGNEQASDEQLLKALERVGLTKWLKTQCSEGLETLLGEDGYQVSGGQRHRLAVARILLKNAPILLLDEPTIGLDPIMEAQLMDTLFKQQSHQTMIWITHHLIGLEQVDQVIFLEQGHSAMQGNPTELYHQNLRFRQLYDLDRGYMEK